ncbi:MAG: zinc-ribbon domain-containing protein, partial [Deltaproteobacteria bacterium]|nr:zinc-ribbon domain-containing protein [Deltaproteobacteria bacterium]
MYFHCLKCNTKYRIDDEKIVNKVLKFSCRTCGVSLLIRDPTWGSPSVYLDDKQPSDLRKIVTEPSRSSTVKIETKQFRELKGDEMIKSQAPIQTKEVWFAIRKGERIGPLAKKDLLEMLLSGKLHEKSFVWRPTMKNWMRMNDLEEMRDILIDALGVPPPPPEAIAEEAPAHPKQGDSVLSKDLFKSLTGETSAGAWTARREEKKIDVADTVVDDSRLSKGLFETLAGETSVSAWVPPEEKTDAKEAEEAARLAEERTDFVESSEEKRFFARAFELHAPPERKEPSEREIYRGLFPAAAPEPEEKPKEEISEKISIASLKPVKEIRPSAKEVKNLVKEFSLMMRLERKSRLAQILLISGIVIFAGGLTTLYILTSSEDETPKMFLDNPSKMTEVPVSRPLYAVMQEEAEKAGSEVIKKKPSSKLSEILKKKSTSKKMETNGILEE